MTAPVSIGRVMDGMLLRREILAAVRADPGTASACLATVVVGDNPRCHIFARGKRSSAAEVGMRSTKVDLTGTATQAEVEDAISLLATDAGVHGIFVQLPLPGHLDVEGITRLVPPLKDVDGMNPDGPHPPTTALAVVRLLDRFEITITGRRVVVVGQVRGMERLLVGRGADVTVTDEATPDTCRPADILIAGAGRPGTIGAGHIRPGATVVDVTGDVDLDQALTVAGAVAPYPATVGPVAVACLLRNTLDAAKLAP